MYICVYVYVYIYMYIYVYSVHNIYRAFALELVVETAHRSRVNVYATMRACALKKSREDSPARI